MSRRRHLDRLTPGDLLMLWPEELGWREDIGAVATLAPQDGGLPIDDVRALVSARLHRVPRLRQRLLIPRFGLGRPLWIDCPDFDVRAHVNLRSLRGDATEDDLLAEVSALFGRRFDWQRPLWQMWLLPGLADGRVGLLVKLHHTLADAQASLALLGAFLDLGAVDVPVDPPEAWQPQPVPTATELLRDNASRRTAAVRHALQSAAHPVRTFRRVSHTASLMRRMARHEKAPATSLNQPVRYDERKLALVRADVAAGRRVAHGHDGTLNDTLLCAVAGGLRGLLAARDEQLERVVANVPVSLHDAATETATGNEVGVMFVSLPVGPMTAGERLRTVTDATAQAKCEMYVPPTSSVMANRTIQRLFWRNMRRQRFTNVYVANVFGPPVPLYLLGARLDDVFPIMSMVGNVTVGIAAISYVGQLNISVIGDGQTAPDLAVLADGMARTLAELGAGAASATTTG